MIGMYEAPQFGTDGCLVDLTPHGDSRTAPTTRRPDPVGAQRRSRPTASSTPSPFYGESSFLMYRKDVLERRGRRRCPRTRRGTRSPRSRARSTRPTMAGICLRGKPGWGDLGAAFTTVLNTFGGTWWSAKPDGTPDKAMVDQPAFKDGARLLRRPGQGRGREGRRRTRASTSAWRSTRTARSPCGTTRPSPPACSRPTTAR